MAYRNNNPRFQPPGYSGYREVEGNSADTERTMQNGERVLIVDTGAGNTSVTLQSISCSLELGTEISIRAQGAGQVTVRPRSGQQMDEVADGSVTVAANTTGRFIRGQSSWYS